MSGLIDKALDVLTKNFMSEVRITSFFRPRLGLLIHQEYTCFHIVRFKNKKKRIPIDLTVDQNKFLDISCDFVTGRMYLYFHQI